MHNHTAEIQHSMQQSLREHGRDFAVTACHSVLPQRKAVEMHMADHYDAVEPEVYICHVILQAYST